MQRPSNYVLLLPLDFECENSATYLADSKYLYSPHVYVRVLLIAVESVNEILVKLVHMRVSAQLMV
jgi:hypothetical protein